MERQNEAQIEDLEGKVSQLRDITSRIGKEVKDSNVFLDMMGIDFDKAGSLLKGTVGHLKTMMQQNNGKHMCYMLVFVLALFFLMYFLRGISSRFGGSGAASLELEQPGNIT